MGAAVVIGAGEDTLVPEAVDFAAGGEAVEGGSYAVFGEDFEAPGAAHDHEQSPDEAWDDGQGQALGQGEAADGECGHSFDSSVSVECEV